MINPYERMKLKALHENKKIKEIDEEAIKSGMFDGRNLYFDRQGKPIDLLQWNELFKDKANRVVRQQYLNPELLVSTVWLGLNHGFDEDEDLEIFETMVFGKTNKDGFREDLEQERYATEAEAIAGHEKYVAKYMQYLKDNKKSVWKSMWTGISNKAKKWLSIGKKR